MKRLILLTTSFTIALLTSTLMTLIILSCGDELIEQYEEIGQLKSAKIDKPDTLILDRVIVKYKGQEKFQVLKDVKDVPGMVNKLNNDPHVEYAEPDYIATHYGFPDDTLYQSGDLWNMYSELSTPANIFGCGAIEAWKQGKTGSNEVWVGIIDQGYFYEHPDLIQNVGKNPWEIPGNGIDDEGNGYIDDVYGWDFYSANNTVFDGTYDFHGTHVAGIIGATGNNQIGVAGVVWNVKFFNAKFLGGYGGFFSGAVDAIDYLIDMKARGMNIVAINNSWGGKERSRALEAAFDRAEAAGILMVCAAGNTGDNKVGWPAAYRNPNIISVASINSAGNLSAFSTYNRRLVDLAAPGENIWSTYIANGTSFYSRYNSLNGTSMAAPHVTGAAALYKSLHPDAGWQEIKTAILNSVIPTETLKGKVMTGGRLDVSKF